MVRNAWTLLASILESAVEYGYLHHIYLSPGIRVLDCWVRNDPLARVASGHRPVIASVEVTWP